MALPQIRRKWLRRDALTCVKCLSSSSSSNPFSADRLLSNAWRQRTVEALNKSSNGAKLRKASSKTSKRSAAVLVPLCVDEQQRVCLLYERRARTLRSHAGEVSFPGGLCDEDDKGDVAVTALRETREELGVARSDLDVWTTMRPVPNKTGDVIVTPVVGEILHPRPMDLEVFRLSPTEVDSVFTVPLEALASPTAARYTQFRVPPGPGYTLPVFDVEPSRVWGMTAIITFAFLRAFLPSDLYTHRVNFQSPIK